MNHKKHIRCDLLVIGRGIAGMAAAARASALGLKTVQAGNSSTLFLGSGLIDLLGVYPAEKGRVLQMPEAGLEKLRTDLPGHPYAKVPCEKIFESLSFLTRFLSDAGLEYRSGKNNGNLFVLTAAGTFKPSFMVPKTFINGCTESLAGKKVLFVDFRGLKGYSAKQIAETVRRVCPGASAVTVEVPGQSGELAPVRLAHLFEDDRFLDTIGKRLSRRTGNVDLVGFPAVCGIHDSLKVIDRIGDMVGCPCFEIPGLPPSIPGLRLKNAFEKKISQNNVMVLNNARVRFNSFENNRFFMTVAGRNMDALIRTRGVILATGRFLGDGLHAGRGEVRETVFGLPVRQPEHRSMWHDLNFFSPGGHGINRAGIETSARFRPADETGAHRFEHLYAAGAILAHNDWIRLKSGSGVSCVSSFEAVNHFYDAFRGKCDD